MAYDDVELNVINDNSGILNIYGKEDVLDFVWSYVNAASYAKTSGNFDIVSDYVEPNSPIYKDLIQSVPATYKKGIIIDLLNMDYESIKIDGSNIYVKVINTFDIKNSVYNEPVKFRSQYKVKMIDGKLYASELMSDELLK